MEPLIDQVFAELERRVMAMADEIAILLSKAGYFRVV